MRRAGFTELISNSPDQGNVDQACVLRWTV